MSDRDENGVAAGFDAQAVLAVLRALADGHARPVPDVAAAARVSVSALEQALPRLADYGLRRRRDGHVRIPGGYELLCVAALRGKLPAATEARLQAVEVLGVTGSTNDHGRALAQRGDPVPHAVLAEAQTAGRGRRGRVWSSPVGANIYLTLTDFLAEGPASSRGLSLAVGVAVAEALEAWGVTAIQLKWPNDLLLEGRKLGGILLELVPHACGGCFVVIGIGINVALPAHAGRTIEQAWTDLRQGGRNSGSRNTLAAAVLAGVVDAVTRFRRHGFDSGVRRAWEARDVFRGQRVLAATDARTVQGVDAGIDEHGALRIETAGAITLLDGGAVTLRSVAAS